MGEDYTRIPIPGLPWLTEVRLYDETWEHITEGHSEFTGTSAPPRAEFENAVANPTYIYASITDPENSVVVVSESLTYQEHPVVVPVKHVEGTSGRVKTAYFTDSTQGEVLWSADDE